MDVYPLYATIQRTAELTGVHGTLICRPTGNCSISLSVEDLDLISDGLHRTARDAELLTMKHSLSTEIQASSIILGYSRSSIVTFDVLKQSSQLSGIATTRQSFDWKENIHSCPAVPNTCVAGILGTVHPMTLLIGSSHGLFRLANETEHLASPSTNQELPFLTGRNNKDTVRQE